MSKTIQFIPEYDRVLLKYRPSDMRDPHYIGYTLETEGRVTIRRVFSFSTADLVEQIELDESDVEYTFNLGIAEGDYFRVNRHILGLKHDLRLDKQMPLSHKTFVASTDISIFGRIDDLIDEPIVVGGNADGAIPLEVFDELLANFPTTTELKHYAGARVTGVLKDYFRTMSDAQKRLDSYLNNKRSIKPQSRVAFLKEYEPRKFEYVRDELHGMLGAADTYAEKDWQRIVVNFLLLIFPRYIAVLENLHIKDYYSNPSRSTDRYIDLTLVDANGTVDIIEIKKPFSNCLLSTRKYRDNYTPKMELSGSVMQVEKYMFHLNKWGRAGELDIAKKRGSELPSGFEIRITNPKAMIILGRDIDFAYEQKFDFEIIRRKYENIMDIMTYDDLLRRLDNIIAMLKHS